jgi:uncharacterized protein (DUF433 family)
MRQPEWRERISIDPDVCHGKPCIRGTRILVSTILDWLQAGEDMEIILGQFPALQVADIRAAIGYAAWLAHEEEELPLRTDAMG